MIKLGYFTYKQTKGRITVFTLIVFTVAELLCKYSFKLIIISLQKRLVKKKIKPLLDRIYEIIDTLRPSKDSHLYSAVTYARNQKEKLYYFIDDQNVEMTNNLAEQTVKSYVINRKNFLFSDTEKGADASAAVMSIIETVKRNKLDVYGYLTHLLTVLPEWGKNPTDEQLESVMPWSESLPDFCRQEYDEIKR